jgi:hypothetical protein
MMIEKMKQAKIKFIKYIKKRWSVRSEDFILYPYETPKIRSKIGVPITFRSTLVYKWSF